jgi:hypothetical protein
MVLVQEALVAVGVFTCSSCNEVDKIPASAEVRSQVMSQVTKAVADEVGADRTGIRVSPFGGFLDVSMLVYPYPHEHQGQTLSLTIWWRLHNEPRQACLICVQIGC